VSACEKSQLEPTKILLQLPGEQSFSLAYKSLNGLFFNKYRYPILFSPYCLNRSTLRHAQLANQSCPDPEATPGEVGKAMLPHRHQLRRPEVGGSQFATTSGPCLLQGATRTFLRVRRFIPFAACFVAAHSTCWSCGFVWILSGTNHSITPAGRQRACYPSAGHRP